MVSGTTGLSLGVLRSPVEVLSRATGRLTERLDALVPPLSPGGPERAEGYLGALRSKIEQVMRGDDPREAREWIAANPFSGVLAEALGRELIDGAMDPEAAPATLVVLRALASMRNEPAMPLTPPPTERQDDLRSRMRGPDAFELLVEVAHDFRSPLTSILFLAEALRDGHSGPVTEAQRSQLGLMYSAAFGLAAIASDIMDLARREKDLIGDEAEPFAISEVFQRVERMVRPLVEEKRLLLRVVAPERWQAHGHPHALSRVLLNLTTNALKFTDEGSVELGVRALPHGRIEFYVQDTGRGISPEQQKNLFQPFRRRSGSSEDGHYFSSSGIGLSIARRLLQAMGSDLSLDSSDERGTRFSFVLPASGRR
jgi:signal transduction histidine kinase